MSKIGLVTKREYLSRVKKKSFIIMTILGPILIAAFYAAIIYFTINDVGESKKNIVIADPSGFLDETLIEEGNINLIIKDQYSRQEMLKDTDIEGWMQIPAEIKAEDNPTLTFESSNNLSVVTMEKVTGFIEDNLRSKRLQKLGVSKEDVDQLETSVNLTELKIGKDGEAKNSSIAINTGIGLALSLIIYFFIFVYGVQIMRGVIEEKTNRIVELIISSVKPFELMMGKVLGLAAVGITQIVIWIALSGILIPLIGSAMGMKSTAEAAMTAGSEDLPMDQMNTVLASLMELDFFKIIVTFLFFFVGGYLMYGAIFAAIGSAVDSETDTQQFMLPITMPLVASIAISSTAILKDPNGPIAMWMSMFPLTSPISMMVRVPFIDGWGEILLSMAILVVSFLFTIWLAGRIYRVGILMYGKKPTYRELYKWLFYKG